MAFGGLMIKAPEPSTDERRGRALFDLEIIGGLLPSAYNNRLLVQGHGSFCTRRWGCIEFVQEYRCQCLRRRSSG